MLSVVTLWELIGGIATVGISLLVARHSREGERKQNALIAAALGFLVTMMISLRFDVVPGIEDGLAVSNSVSSLPRVADLVAVIAKTDSEHAVHQDPLGDYIFNLRLDRLEREFELLANGSFTVDPVDMPDFALRLADRSKKSFKATSIVTPGEWWNTPWGQSYLSINYSKIRQGISITRIFILESEESLQAVSGLLEEQKKNGIEVFYALSSDIGVDVNEDMVVVDGDFAGVLRLTPDRRMQSAVFYTRSRDVQEVKRRFDLLLSYCELY